MNLETQTEPVAPTELEVYQANAVTLFATSDPRTALARMTDIAAVLVDVVRERRLAVRISGREHLTAEAWTTLGAMLGVVPVVVWTRLNESGDGYIARVEARTLDGRVVGAAESECSRSESKWQNRDAFALRSMAQTRAISRALRAPLGMITVLAGYEPTPSEEMPVVDGTAREPEPSSSGSPAEPVAATREQLVELGALLVRLGELDPVSDWQAHAREIAGGQHADALTRTGARIVADELRATVAQLEQTDTEATDAAGA
jgi:hypothetical protein